MSNIARIKKKAQEGFKSFVCNLEQTPPEKRAEIFQAGILEDPLYMKWVTRNLHSVNYFFEMNENDLSQLIEAIPNTVPILIKAFYFHPQKDEFFKKIIPKKYQSSIEEEMSYVGEVTLSISFHAQSLAMKTLRDLQNKRELEGPTWHFPDDKTLSEMIVYPDGKSAIYFEDGTIAAEGIIEKGKRVGPWKHYFDSGKLLAEGNYELGLKWGEWTFYFMTGQVKAKGTYFEDSKHGQWNEFDRHGAEKIVQFNLGKKIEG